MQGTTMATQRRRSAGDRGDLRVPAGEQELPAVIVNERGVVHADDGRADAYWLGWGCLDYQRRSCLLP